MLIGLHLKYLWVHAVLFELPNVGLYNQYRSNYTDIGEYLLAINSYRTNYQEDCFSVLYRARNKVQLNILEAIYITLDHPLRAVLKKSWRQHPTRHQQYGHLPPITKTIQVRQTRHAGHCRRSKDELISDVLLWTPTYGCAKAGRPARTYIQQLCEDTGCNSEDLPEAMNDREKWRERRDMMMMMILGDVLSTGVT